MMECNTGFTILSLHELHHIYTGNCLQKCLPSPNNIEQLYFQLEVTVIFVIKLESAMLHQTELIKFDCFEDGGNLTSPTVFVEARMCKRSHAVVPCSIEVCCPILLVAIA